MVTSGLPERNGNSHAQQLAYLALDILSYMATFMVEGITQSVDLRIGLHTGKRGHLYPQAINQIDRHLSQNGHLTV